MDLERWQKLESIFHEAVGREPSQISAFLRTACAGDDRLRIEAEKLLAAHLQASGFIKEPGFGQAVQLLGDRVENEDLAGRQFGPYRVVRELGRGGMGVVYLAERADDQYRKTVAIKLIRRGMASDAVLRRFRHERQILANLEHPNIARLIDGGTSEEGLPFFVMEYVEGGPINDFCNARNLPLKKRLELFQNVCAGVEYAHRRQVIHRDLKPSNILVTADGIPKLLDFGIAKIVDDGEGVDTMRTATGIRLMTPDYASPEQVRGRPLTPLTDIYSLGVILEELIAGPRPKTGPWRQVSDTDGSTDTMPHVDSRLRAILRTARHEQQDHRYQSAEALSDDIRLYLAGLSIAARSDETTIRPKLFAVRRMAASAAVVLVLLLLGGVITTAYQNYAPARSERTDQAEAEKGSVDRRITEIRRISLPAPTGYREAMEAISRLDKLAADQDVDETASLEIASAYERIADAQKELTARSGNNLAAAVDGYRKSLKIRGPIAGQARKDLDLRRDTAYTYLKLAKLEHETRELTSAVDNGRLALEHLMELVRERPADADFRDRMMQAYYEVGQILHDSGAAEAADAHYCQVGKLIETLPPPKTSLS